MRRLLLGAIITLWLTVAASAQGVLVVAAGGDSLTGCARDWFFHTLNVTSIGNCGVPFDQAAAVYPSSIGPKVLGVNLGISGTRLSAGSNPFTAMASSYMAPIAAVKTVSSFAAIGTPIRGPPRYYLALCGIGSNDGAVGSDGTPAAYAADHASVCSALKANGYNWTLMVTLLPRADGTMTETDRLAYNATITDPTWQSQHGIDGVVDIASEPTCGNPANLPANNGGATTYYDSDNIHYNDTCGALFAPIVKAKLKATAPAGLINYVLKRDLDPAANDNTPAWLDQAA